MNEAPASTKQDLKRYRDRSLALMLIIIGWLGAFIYGLYGWLLLYADQARRQRSERSSGDG